MLGMSLNLVAARHRLGVLWCVLLLIALTGLLTYFFVNPFNSEALQEVYRDGRLRSDILPSFYNELFFIINMMVWASGTVVTVGLFFRDLIHVADL